MASPFFRFCDLNGNGTGSKQLNVDGSITPVIFKLAPLADQDWIAIANIHVLIEDAGAMSPDGFGNMAALTNGVKFSIFNASDDSERLDLMDGLPIKYNSSWGEICDSVDYDDFGTPTDTFLRIRWALKDSGEPLRIGKDGYFGVTVADNLTGLVSFAVNCQGNYGQ